jgi:hypothetical protein
MEKERRKTLISAGSKKKRKGCLKKINVIFSL